MRSRISLRGGQRLLVRKASDTPGADDRNHGTLYRLYLPRLYETV